LLISTGHESLNNTWALVDFGDAIGVVPIDNVKAKKNKDGSVDEVMHRVLWSDGKAYDAVIIVEGSFYTQANMH